MKKFETIKWAALIIAGIGVIFFWIFGFKGLNEQSATSLIISGICAWIAIFAIIAEEIYKRRHIMWDIDRRLP